MRRLLSLIATLIAAQSCQAATATSQPPHCAQILYCLFNQEAAASSPAGIHKYSENLIDVLVQNLTGDESTRELAGRLADRLANAEQSARAGNRRLVPEAVVAEAFDDLMQEIGAPASMRTDERSVHQFREHAASIHAFPALLTGGHNGTDCNPGEAVFLFSLLISENGALRDGNLDNAVALMRRDGQPNRDERNSGVARMEGSFGAAPSEKSMRDAMWFLASYSSQHNRNAVITLVTSVAGTFGF